MLGYLRRHREEARASQAQHRAARRGAEPGKIVSHVLEAEAPYLGRLGGRYKVGSGRPDAEMKAMRKAFRAMLEFRVEGDEPEMGRRTAALWTPRYAIRRSAWHALDHAWEIEDRAG